MDPLVVVAIGLALLALGVVVFERVRTRRPPAIPSGTGRANDADGVDEADLVAGAAGGELAPDDVAVVPIADPAPWGARSFELDLPVAAAARAEIVDDSGHFSFLVYWLQPGQAASLLALEGDALAYGEAFVGRTLDDATALEAVAWCRDRYLAPEATADFDLTEFGLGAWAALAARGGGRLRVEAGQTPLLPAAAGVGTGLPYRDFTLGRAEDGRQRLRLVEVGAYRWLFIGEVAPLRDLRVLRRRTDRRA